MESQFTNQENNFQQESVYTYYSAQNLTVEDIPDPNNRIIAMYAVVFSLVGFGNEVEELGVPALLYGFFSTVGCIAMSIVAVVLGVKSIKCFKRKMPRPIATLILGISSVVEASSAVVVALYDFFFILVALLTSATI